MLCACFTLLGDYGKVWEDDEQRSVSLWRLIDGDRLQDDDKQLIRSNESYVPNFTTLYAEYERY